MTVLNCSERGFINSEGQHPSKQDEHKFKVLKGRHPNIVVFRPFRTLFFAFVRFIGRCPYAVDYKAFSLILMDMSLNKENILMR